MGKTQSKSVGLYRKRDYSEGELFVVNAHFNPLGIDDGEETLLKTKSTATSEITLSVNSCSSVGVERVGFADDKYPLKVVLPPETGGGNETGGGDVGGIESHLKESNKKWEAPTGCANSTCFNQDKTPKNNSSKMKSNSGIQGFECDVSVEADFSGKQKREFVFTLYDLDGDGQITKDDITGLVRSMYEALGSSLKLPPSGSRTIRVRLTMSPGKKVGSNEKKKSSSNGECQGCKNKEAETENNMENEKETPPVVVVDQENADLEEEGETDEEDPKITPHRHYLLSNCLRKTPPHRSKRRDMTSSFVRPSAHKSKTQRSSQGYRSVSPCNKRRTRVSFSKEQQLLEIIQSNLEKKNCGQCQGHTQRKRSGNLEGTPRQHHVRRIKSDYNRCECVVDSCQDHGRLCPYQIINTHSGCSKGENNFQCQKSRHNHHNHNRSHSHEVNESYQQAVEEKLNPLRVEDILLKDVRTTHAGIDWFGNLLSQKKNGLHYHARSKSFDPQYGGKIACNLMTLTPCKFKLDSDFGYLSYHHHHKHRHREEDHQRAMEQVASWIEKEHSGLRGSGAPQQNNGSGHHTNQDANPETAEQKKNGTVPAVERHEHHHVHQHYHHHYHHYHQL